MRKRTTFLLFLGMLLAFSMTSCEKDGVYIPKKKIQRVFFSTNNTDKYLAEEWYWNKNLLGTINHIDDSRIEYFSYEGKRLSRVDNYINSEHTTYEYDGKYLKSSSYYYKDNLEATAQYTYSGKKLSSESITLYSAKASGKKQAKVLTQFFPKEVNEIINRHSKSLFAPNPGKGVLTYKVQYTWDGDNISTIMLSGDGETMTISLQYDDKINPKKGFYELYSYENVDNIDGGGSMFSKNNVTKAIFTYEGENDVYTFTYQYDKDNYPTMQITHYPSYTYYDWDCEDYIEVDVGQSTIYYEYQ